MKLDQNLVQKGEVTIKKAKRGTFLHIIKFLNRLIWGFSKSDEGYSSVEEWRIIKEYQRKGHHRKNAADAMRKFNHYNSKLTCRASKKSREEKRLNELGHPEHNGNLEAKGDSRQKQRGGGNIGWHGKGHDDQVYQQGKDAKNGGQIEGSDDSHRSRRETSDSEDSQSRGLPRPGSHPPYFEASDESDFSSEAGGEHHWADGPR